MKFVSAVACLFASVPVVNSLGATDQATCRCNPDPHFKTWHDTFYDYHGGCDLVLIKSPGFSPTGLDLHIRTVPFLGWGGITNAALRIDSDIIEVLDNGDYYFNSILNDPLTTIGGYTVTQSGGVFEVALNGVQYVRISSWNSMSGGISIEVLADGSDFLTSVGLCGTWTTPVMIARDGVTDFDPDGVLFGENWQVDPSLDPLLFQSTPPPQYPDSCEPANTSGGGQGGEGGKGRDDAEEACADIVGPDHENCVFDVVTTGDETWADAPFYDHARCMSEEDYCQRKGGECVSECDPNTHYCDRELCQLPRSKLDFEIFQGIRCFCAIPL